MHRNLRQCNQLKSLNASEPCKALKFKMTLIFSRLLCRIRQMVEQLIREIQLSNSKLIKSIRDLRDHPKKWTVYHRFKSVHERHYFYKSKYKCRITVDLILQLEIVTPIATEISSSHHLRSKEETATSRISSSTVTKARTTHTTHPWAPKASTTTPSSE